MTPSWDLLGSACLIGGGGAAAMDLWAGAAGGSWASPVSTTPCWDAGSGTSHGAASPTRTSPGPDRSGANGCWSAHYAIGVAFALGLLLVTGPGWAHAPTPWPALVTGWVTVAAPWLVMQPAMGLGVAAARAPRPWSARLRNLATHTAYGIGLYAAALALAAASP